MPILSFTFDDGNASQVRDLYPLLRDHALPATFYVIASEIGLPGRLTESDLRSLSEEGNEIGSHGYTHRSLVTLKPDQLKDELEKSKRALSRYGVRTLSYPFGRFDSRVVIEVARYYDSARTYSIEMLSNRKTPLNRYSLHSFPVEGRFQTRIQPQSHDFIFSGKNLRSEAWFIITLHGQVSVNPWRVAYTLMRSPTKEQLQSYFGYAGARLFSRHQGYFLQNFQKLCCFLAANDDTITVSTVSQTLDQFS